MTDDLKLLYGAERAGEKMEQKMGGFARKDLGENIRSNPRKETKRSNLLYVFADQWRFAAQGWVKQDQVRTPNMDEFAKESMKCTECYSTFPLCSPHRASLMTGKYPIKAGMWTNCKIGLEEILMLKPQELCIGNVLQENGYHTGYIGKWHLDASEENFSPHPASGAKNWDAYTPPGERRQGFEDWLSYGACDKHLDPHYWKDSPQQIKPGKWSAEYETDMAIESMERYRKEERPFALFLSYNPPHLPYELVPDKYYDQYRDLEVHYRPNVPEEMRKKGGLLETQTRQYFAAVAGVDEQFGRLLSFLKEKGMEEDTIVVLSADHGEMLGSHGMMSKNIWYEEALHIPLNFRQKGRIQPGEYTELFASIDHMPTILGLLDLPVPDTCDGVSHAQGILGKGVGRRKAEADVDEVKKETQGKLEEEWQLQKIQGWQVEDVRQEENVENDNRREEIQDKAARKASVPQEMFICSYPGSAEMVAAFARKGLAHKAYGWRGIKTKRYTYVISNGYAPGEKQAEYLYDHKTDLFEQHPLSLPVNLEEIKEPELRKLIRHFRQKLTQYLEQQKDPFLIR